MIEVASDRARGSIRGVKDYLRLTRLIAGPYPCFFPIEMDLYIPRRSQDSFLNGNYTQLGGRIPSPWKCGRCLLFPQRSDV